MYKRNDDDKVKRQYGKRDPDYSIGQPVAQILQKRKSSI